MVYTIFQSQQIFQSIFSERMSLSNLYNFFISGSLPSDVWCCFGLFFCN